MLKPNYSLLQSLWVWQHFMDRIVFFYYSIYTRAYFDEKKTAWKSHSKPKNYGEQALRHGDSKAKQDGKE